MDLDYENIQVDREEFLKQTYENIRKTEHYIEATFVVGNNNEAVIPNVIVRGANNLTVAKFIMALEEITKEMKLTHPEAEILKNIALKCDIEDISGEE
jgi:hypothetical protein